MNASTYGISHEHDTNLHFNLYRRSVGPAYSCLASVWLQMPVTLLRHISDRQ